jgi:HPt (histidine-containing phosphotransfer) domain-containing protein
MNDFLAKPIEAKELNRVLSTWLPPEKISGPVPTSKSPPVAYSPNTLLALFSVPELDVNEGLTHVGGNISVYIDILRQFCTECDSILEKIRLATAAENWKDYAIRLHGVKGVFANIGVESLRAWAYKLELAGKNQEAGVCRAETDPFCAAMTQFRDKLAAVT